MQQHTLTVDLCRDSKGGPLATVSGLPGDDFDATPARLRALAAALLKVPADAEAEASKPAPRRGGYVVQRRTYPTA